MTSRSALLALLSLLTLTTAPASAEGVGAWDYAGKTGVGTAYAPYGPHRADSKVWYSVADGYLTETMYGLIHEAQLKSARVVVVTDSGLVVEGENTVAETRYLHVDARGRPLSPALSLITRDVQGRVEIEKRLFTDPDHNALFIRITVRPLKGKVTAYLLVEPHMDNSVAANVGAADPARLSAHQTRAFLTTLPVRAFAAASADPLGAGDGLAQLRRDGRLSHPSGRSGPGSILLSAQLGGVVQSATTYDVIFGFGGSDADSLTAAKAARSIGYQTLLKRFNGEGGKTGWSAYLGGLSQLKRVAAQSLDGGRLAYASALALKTQEDKTYDGALIASLSNPWGETVQALTPSTGYKAVWPRDFYECAMALAALGDRKTPVAALRYLPTVQVGPKTPGASGAVGWFQQKSHVNGDVEWPGVQLDETAMPIMLAWKLHAMGLISDGELSADYRTWIAPAARFLVDGGDVAIAGGPTRAVRPPFTEQERWEEMAGYSPSTIAAVITGLTLAADIAAASGDSDAAARFQAAADRDSQALEPRTFVSHGALADHGYYLRLSSTESAEAAPAIPAHNGLSALPADQMVDAGFLELVRYGVRRADDPHVTESLKVIDDQGLPDDLRMRYDFHFPGDGRAYPGFRRYGHDGYGEDTVTATGFGADNGRNSAHQRGRVWPLLTGERGHYALALASANGPASPRAIDEVRATYVGAMEHFANGGMMLPEQVYDGVGSPLNRKPAVGAGTGSATPLSWAHAEYIKLLRSLADGRVFDVYAPVRARYAQPSQSSSTR